MSKILLIEDDKDLAIMINEWLSAERHLIEAVTSGRDGLEHLRMSEYDLVVLDLTLPDMSGLAVLTTLRAERVTTPVLILTGKKAVSDKEAGLDAGADDYLTKPFNMKELWARIRALVRRSSMVLDNVLKVSDLVLDPVKHKVTRGGVVIQLLPREFSLLELLMRYPDKVFSAESLLQRLWQSDTEITTDSIRTYVMRLRHKIDRPDGESMIETIPRIGYRLKSEG